MDKGCTTQQIRVVHFGVAGDLNEAWRSKLQLGNASNLDFGALAETPVNAKQGKEGCNDRKHATGDLHRVLPLPRRLHVRHSPQAKYKEHNERP